MNGRFGEFGGQYVPETVMNALIELEEAYGKVLHDKDFNDEYMYYLKYYTGRPSPLYYAENMTKDLGGAKVYLKREDLNHTGAHKINNALGQVLLAKRMGKKKVIAETGAGQHGVALATAAAFFGLECEIHMGEVDIAKQAPNVTRMKILGAKVVPVSHGLKTLKEAVDSAFESYAKNYKDSIYCIGSALGPHPFPLMVRDFQSVVGYEAKEQFKEMTGLLPDVVTACVGGGSNAAGMFIPFLDEPVDIIGVEPLGRGEKLGDHAASMKFGEKGIMHGFESIMLKDKDEEPAPVYSIASGLDYPSVGPEHAFLRDVGRVNYNVISDEEAMEAFFKLSRYEGIIPAIESSHAVAYAMKKAKEMKQGSILVCLSGRGDKDIDYVVENYGYGDQYFK